MPTDSAVIDKIRPLGAIFHARDAVEHGISWRDLYQVRDSGLLIEVSRGLFQLREAAGIDQIDFVVVCARAPQGMVCFGLRSRSLGFERRNPDPGGPGRSGGEPSPADRLSTHPRPRLWSEQLRDLAASRWRSARTSVFASLTPKGLSSTASVSDIALGSTSPSPVCAATFAVRGLQPGRVLELARSCEFARRSSKRCGCCKNESGPTRLDHGARLSRPPADGTSARVDRPKNCC